MVFRDRRDAGRRLASQLAPLKADDPVVIGLPRGGVPVAFEVAQGLGAPLDVLAVRKIGAPGHPELGVGAIAEDGTALLDPRIARATGMTDDLLRATVARERRELTRRVTAYRDGRPPMRIAGRTVVAVDDGLATGLTDLAAIRALRNRGARKVVVAVPVGSREGVDLVAGEADEVVCLAIPHDFVAVGMWYQDFSEVSDAEVLAMLGAPPAATPPAALRRGISISIDGELLRGDLAVPPHARGLVLFAHGSGSSRRSPRNRAVAERLQRAGLATLLFDLLNDAESGRRDLVFDIPLLATRLESATRWAMQNPATAGLPIGYFGASTGAAAAIRAAAEVGGAVQAVVSRGGRPDLAADRVGILTAPTLLIVGEEDREVLALNRRAAALMRCPHEIAVVPGASHLFEEPGTLELAAGLAAKWFVAHLRMPGLSAAVGG